MTKTKSQKLRAMKARVKGKGDYDIVSDNKIDNLEKRVNKLESRIPRNATTKVGQLAGLAGRALGSTVGLGELGHQAGTAMAKLFGHGDYDIKTNSLISGRVTKSSSIPSFEPDGRRGVRIREREYLGDIYSGVLASGSTVFDLTAYEINPGVSHTFPWLSTIAQQFEEYVPNGIVFEFVSTSSTFNGASQALGTVICATDYDPTDPNYVGKVDMENADYANSCKASECLMHGIECDNAERPMKTLYVRTGSIGANDNLRFYDLGKFQIATIGMSTAGVNLGELWVSYDFTFYKKQLVGGTLASNNHTCVYYNTTGVTTSLFGTVSAASIASNFDVRFSGATISFPPRITAAVYAVQLGLEGNFNGSLIPPDNATLFNCDSNAKFPDTSGALVWTQNIGWFWEVEQLTTLGATDLFWSKTYWVKVTGPNATLTFTGMSGLAEAGYVRVNIYQLPYNALPLVQ